MPQLCGMRSNHSAPLMRVFIIVQKYKIGFVFRFFSSYEYVSLRETYMFVARILHCVSFAVLLTRYQLLNCVGAIYM